MNIASYLEPHLMIYSIFNDKKSNDKIYKLSTKSKGVDLNRFRPLINSLLDIASNEEVTLQDDWLEVEFHSGGIQIATIFGDEEEDEDEYSAEGFGNAFFYFDKFGNFESIELEQA